MELRLHSHVRLNGMVPECRQIYSSFPFMLGIFVGPDKQARGCRTVVSAIM